MSLLQIVINTHSLTALDQSQTLKLNTFDAVFLDPSYVPVLGDTVTLTNPTWTGNVTAVKTSDPDVGAHTYVTVTATNTAVATASAATIQLMDVGYNGVTSIGYKDLSIQKQTNTDGTTTTTGTVTVFISGLTAGQTFLLTSVNQSLSSQSFSVTDVETVWPVSGGPEYHITFGDPIVTMAVWAAAQAADAPAGSIPGTSITEGSVDTPQLKANAVTAAKLAAQIVLAGSIGTAASGARVVLDMTGFHVYDSAGNLLVNFPVDGTPDYFNGEVDATTLNVSGEVLMQGSLNEVGNGGLLQVDNYQGNPVSAPSLAQSLPVVTFPYDPTTEPNWTNSDVAGVRSGLYYDSAGGADGATKVFLTCSADDDYATLNLLELKASDRTVNRSVTMTVPGGGIYGMPTVARLGAGDIYVAWLHGTDGVYVQRYTQATLALGATYGPLTAGLNSQVRTIPAHTYGAGNYLNISVDGSAYAGLFTYGSNLTAAAIQSYLRTLTGDAGLTVTGTTNTGPFTITWDDLTRHTLSWWASNGSPTVALNTSEGGWGPFPPVIASDGTNIFIVGQNSLASSPTVRWVKYGSTMVKSGSVIDTTFAPGANVNVAAAYAGSADFGAARVAILFGTDGGAYSGTVQTFTSAGAIQVNEPWSVRTASDDFGGLAYGDALGTGACFWTFAGADFENSGSGTNTGLSQHTTWTWTTASSKFWVAYTWQDTNTTGSTHETQVGPRNSITMSRRWQLSVSNAALPTATLPANDYANGVAVYMKPNATDPGATALKQQVTDALTTRILTTYNTAGAADPSSNTFSTLSNASIIAPQTTGWSLHGDGTKGAQICIVVASVTQAISSAGTVMNFNTKTSDRFGIQTSASSYTAPWAGFYRLTYHGSWAANATATRRVSVFQKNGANMADSEVEHTWVAPAAIAIHVVNDYVCLLAKGDVINVWCAQLGVSSINTDAAAGVSFVMEYIGSEE